MYKIHKINKNCLKKGKFEIVIIIITIIVVRFNIINSIHNFASIESQNQYFYYLLIVVLFGIIFLIAHLFNMKIFLGVYLIFIILLYILYLVLIFNLLVVDFFNISYNLQTNIKYIYIYILLLCLLLLFLKKNQSIVF